MWTSVYANTACTAVYSVKLAYLIAFLQYLPSGYFNEHNMQRLCLSITLSLSLSG